MFQLQQPAMGAVKEKVVVTIILLSAEEETIVYKKNGKEMEPNIQKKYLSPTLKSNTIWSFVKLTGIILILWCQMNIEKMNIVAATLFVV